MAGWHLHSLRTSVQHYTRHTQCECVENITFKTALSLLLKVDNLNLVTSKSPAKVTEKPLHNHDSEMPLHKKCRSI